MTNENEIMQNTCDECGCVDEELFELDGKLLCADCAEAAGYKRCEDCDEWVREEDGYTTAGGKFICEDCRDSGDYSVCDDCDEIVDVDEMFDINPGMHGERLVCSCCADDYQRCDDCGNLFGDKHVHSDEWGAVVCDDCYDRSWYTCVNCGRLVRSDEVMFDRNNDPVCADCYDEGNSESFHDYGYKPDPEFQFRSSELSELASEQGRVVSSYEAQDFAPTFGVELEVDCGDDHNDLADELEELDEPIYMKHDGSLGDEGVEIIWFPLYPDPVKDGIQYHPDRTSGAELHGCNVHRCHDRSYLHELFWYERCIRCRTCRLHRYLRSPDLLRIHNTSEIRRIQRTFKFPSGKI